MRQAEPMPSAPLTIRPAHPDDLDQLVLLCAAHAAFEGVTYTIEGKSERLATLLFAPHARLYSLVAEWQDDLVGYATWTPQVCTWDARLYAYMDCLYLIPQARSYGIGRKLMAHLMRDAFALGCRQVQWQTPADNSRAISFYDKLGTTRKEKARFAMTVQAMHHIMQTTLPDPYPPPQGNTRPCLTPVQLKPKAMSVYTHPAHSAPEEGTRYRQALLDLLGDEDPWDILKTTAAWCTHVLETTTPEQLLITEGIGKWSIVEVIHHLADTEIVWSYRIRKVLAEDRPVLVGFDQDLWARRLHYTARAPLVALALFRAARAATLELLQTVDEAGRSRVGLHNERGEESVAAMIRIYAGHDLVHRRQIIRIRAAFSSS